MQDAHPFTIGYEAIFDKGTVRFNEDGYENNRVENKLSLFTSDERLSINIPDVFCNEEEIRHVLTCCIGFRNSTSNE